MALGLSGQIVANLLALPQAPALCVPVPEGGPHSRGELQTRALWGADIYDGASLHRRRRGRLDLFAATTEEV